jgi:hypothetical protein
MLSNSCTETAAFAPQSRLRFFTSLSRCYNRFSFSTKVYLLFNRFYLRKNYWVSCLYQYVKELIRQRRISRINGVEPFSDLHQTAAFSKIQISNERAFRRYLYLFADLKVSSNKWWRISESNRWPPACKAGALASWANPPIFCSPARIWTADPHIISVVL